MQRHAYRFIEINVGLKLGSEQLEVGDRTVRVRVLLVFFRGLLVVI